MQARKIMGVTKLQRARSSKLF